MSCQLLFSLPKSLENKFLFYTLTHTRDAKLNAAAFRRTATVVRNRSDVADSHDVQAGGGQRAHGGFAAGAGTLHANFHALHAELVPRGTRGRQRSLLRRIRRALARTLEADCAGRRRTDHPAIRIGDGDLGIVERSGHVHDAVRHGAALALLLELFLLFITRRTRLYR